MNNFFSPIYTCATYLLELVCTQCTLWPQTVIELLAVLHEKIKTNIHLISINAFKKTVLFFLSSPV